MVFVFSSFKMSKLTSHFPSRSTSARPHSFYDYYLRKHDLVSLIPSLIEVWSTGLIMCERILELTETETVICSFMQKAVTTETHGKRELRLCPNP